VIWACGLAEKTSSQKMEYTNCRAVYTPESGFKLLEKRSIRPPKMQPDEIALLIELATGSKIGRRMPWQDLSVSRTQSGMKILVSPLCLTICGIWILRGTQEAPSCRER
jgi:hypothetical protein